MSELIEKETTKEALKPPGMWAVVFHNDDYTPIEFVVACLMQVFHKNREQAHVITMQVHNAGKGIAGTYTKDIALTKQKDAIDFARKEGHPLLIDIQEI